MKDVKFAFDRASVRTYDADGMMHVSRTPISKANVCVYYGKEIPNWQSLGLNPEKEYRLLRDPEELKKAAPTFNNKPVLNRHIAFSVENPPKDAVVGSTGTDAEFDYPYLYNSMVIHDLDSIMGVETDRQREISPSYRYRADMTPGVFEGEPHDGVMRDLVCNHAAIVPVGRTGHDVLVYDEKPTGRNLMSKLTEKLMSVFKTALANDEKPEDVEKKVDAVIKDEATQAEKDNESEAERLRREERELKEREDRENKDRKRDRAEDEDEDDKDKKSKTADDEDDDKKEKEKMANDSRLAMDAAIKGVEARFTALRQAERDVRPVVGDLACDSAEEVYRTALKQMGCEDHASLPEGALRSVFNALAKAPTMAQDSAPITSTSRDNVANFFEGK